MLDVALISLAPSETGPRDGATILIAGYESGVERGLELSSSWGEEDKTQYPEM